MIIVSKTIYRLVKVQFDGETEEGKIKINTKVSINMYRVSTYIKIKLIK